MRYLCFLKLFQKSFSKTWFIFFFQPFKKLLFCAQIWVHSPMGSITGLVFGSWEGSGSLGWTNGRETNTSSNSPGPRARTNSLARVTSQRGVGSLWLPPGGVTAQLSEQSPLKSSVLPQFFDEGNLVLIADSVIPELLLVLCELLSSRGQMVRPPYIGPARWIWTKQKQSELGSQDRKGLKHSVCRKGSSLGLFLQQAWDRYGQVLWGMEYMKPNAVALAGNKDDKSGFLGTAGWPSSP